MTAIRIQNNVSGGLFIPPDFIKEGGNNMNNALEEVYTSLRRLQNKEVDRKTKEKLEEILRRVNHIAEDLDDEYKNIYSVMNIMDSDPAFRESMDYIMQATRTKKREMDEWEDIKQIIRRLID